MGHSEETGNEKSLWQKLLYYIEEYGEAAIGVMMIGTMTVAGIAFYIYAAYKSYDNIFMVIYCANIVVYLAGVFTGVFRKRRLLITLIIISAAFSFIYLIHTLVFSTS
jgi:hypothetical protein